MQVEAAHDRDSTHGPDGVSLTQHVTFADPCENGTRSKLRLADGQELVFKQFEKITTDLIAERNSNTFEKLLDTISHPKDQH